MLERAWTVISRGQSWGDRVNPLDGFYVSAKDETFEDAVTVLDEEIEFAWEVERRKVILHASEEEA